MKIGDRKIKFAFRVLNRLFFLCLVFIAGIFWNEDLYPWLIFSILLFVAIIYAFLLPVVKSIVNKEIIAVNTRMKVVNIVIQTRTNQWEYIYEKLNDFSGSDKDNWELLKQENVLNTRFGISNVIKVLGKQFEEQIKNGMGNTKNVRLKVAYYQLSDENANIIRLRHPDNMYCTIIHDSKCDLIKRDREFSRGDGTTVGLSWYRNEPIFISDTDQELLRTDSDRRLKELANDECTKSIACIPIKTNNLFFGVLSFSCNRPNIIQDTQSFRDLFLKELFPIIGQLSLMEIIKRVHDIFWNRFEELAKNESNYFGGVKLNV
jgi:hypothetical protein